MSIRSGQQSNPIRIGVVGLQHEGHARGFMEAVVQQCPDAKIVAIADHEPVRHEEYRQLPDVTFYTDFRAMLDRERLNAAFVASINSERADAIVECIRHRLPVLSDKPICTTVAQLERIADAYREYRGVLSVQLTERFNPGVIAMKKAIDDGAIGTPVAIEGIKPHRLHLPTFLKHGRPAWMFDPATYGGVFVDLGIHDVDIVRWLSGEDVRSVSAVIGLSKFAREYPRFTDYAMALLRLGENKAATVEVDWLHPGAQQNRLIAYGTEGFAAIDGSLVEDQLVRIDRDDKVTFLRGTMINPLHAHARDFIDAVRSGRPVNPPAKDAMIATLATLCCRESAELGGEVDVESHPLMARLRALE